MKRTLASISLLAFTLTGCMGGGETQDEELQAEAQAQAASASSTVQFSYPIAGQSGFPASAPLIVRYGMPVTTPESEIGPENLILEIQDGESFTEVDNPEQLIQNVRIVGGGQTLRVDTGRDLQPGARYRLTVTGLSVNGEITGTEEIEFTTAPNRSTGTVTQRLSADAEDITDFRVTGLTPFSTAVDGSSLGQGSSNFPITNHNTLRVVFTQPVDENTVDYGPNGVQLQDADGNPVNDVEVWTRGNRMTIDPEGVLKAGENYELRFSEKLKSALTQEPLAGDRTWEFTPQEARPVLDDGSIAKRAPLVQDAVDGSAGKVRYTGNDYNSVVLGATTLGQGNKTIQRGTVTASLGDLQRFESEGKAVPLTVERGTLMKGTSVDVLVGGELQTEFRESGEIDVRFLSDANGYMMMNPYQDSDNAPRVIRLFADLSMNTDKAKANGALSQELLHVELVGTAQIIDGKLTLEAVSVIQPDVLGVDKASGLISFRLEAYNDPEDAPAGLGDSSGPKLKAWTPGENHQDKMQPQAPITLFFDEPLMPSTVNNQAVKLDSESQAGLPVNVRQNGPNIIVEPVDSLEFGESYTISFPGSIKDLSGQAASLGALKFEMPKSAANAPVMPNDGKLPDATGKGIQVGPRVLTSRPGYPCAKTELPENFQKSDANGRCAGGITKALEDERTSGDLTADFVAGETNDNYWPFADVDTHLKNADDRLPIEAHPADEPVVVRFSQDMDLSSIDKQSFIVEKWTGNGWEDAAYTLTKDKRQVKAIPREKWDISKDDGSEVFYRYRLTDAIKSDVNQLPIYAKILSQFNKENPRPITDLSGGGHELENRFQAVSSSASQNVLTPLSNLPTADANGNLNLDKGQEDQGLTSASIPYCGSGTDCTNTADTRVTLEDVLGIPGEPAYPGFEVPANSAAMQMSSIQSDVLTRGAVGCQPGQDCAATKKMIYKTAKLDVEVGAEPETILGEEGIPVDLDPSVLYTSSSDVWIELKDDVLAFLATENSERMQRVPTGPMVMRMRYQGEDRDKKIQGVIYQGEDGLRFKTKLDVYLDAPYLYSQLSGKLGVTTTLHDNMRSFPINGLILDGPIKFFDDGRMQIVQKNLAEAIDLEVNLRGAIDVQLANESCESKYSFQFLIDACEAYRDSGLFEAFDSIADIIIGGTANAALEPNTIMNLKIPRGGLHLNYITPYTQQRE